MWMLLVCSGAHAQNVDYAANFSKWSDAHVKEMRASAVAREGKRAKRLRRTDQQRGVNGAPLGGDYSTADIVAAGFSLVDKSGDYAVGLQFSPFAAFEESALPSEIKGFSFTVRGRTDGGMSGAVSWSLGGILEPITANELLFEGKSELTEATRKAEKALQDQLIVIGPYVVELCEALIPVAGGSPDPITASFLELCTRVPEDGETPRVPARLGGLAALASDAGSGSAAVRKAVLQNRNAVEAVKSVDFTPVVIAHTDLRQRFQSLLYKRSVVTITPSFQVDTRKLISGFEPKTAATQAETVEHSDVLFVQGGLGVGLRRGHASGLVTGTYKQSMSKDTTMKRLTRASFGFEGSLVVARLDGTKLGRAAPVLKKGALAPRVALGVAPTLELSLDPRDSQPSNVEVWKLPLRIDTHASDAIAFRLEVGVQGTLLEQKADSEAQPAIEEAWGRQLTFPLAISTLIKK